MCLRCVFYITSHPKRRTFSSTARRLSRGGRVEEPITKIDTCNHSEQHADAYSQKQQTATGRKQTIAAVGG
jgi:hypothetical protein